MIKNIIIGLLIATICAQQFAKIENIKDDSITVYTPDDILFILPNSNTIETETGKQYYFADRKALSEFISNQTSEVVNIAISTNYDSAKYYVDEQMKLYNLSTDEEISEVISKAKELYNLSAYEVELIEKFFYI